MSDLSGQDHGFRGIDTANQRKHYFEQAVGEGIAQGLAENNLSREDLFLQSKFTYQLGQDHRLPYDPNASLSEQVQQSLLSTLEHLRTNYLDSFILHGPYYQEGLGDEDWQVWRAMESLYEQGLVKSIGISNINLAQLESLIAGASVAPMYVQNRCFAITQWDKAVREICVKNKIVYQGFSLLTANQQYLYHPQLMELTQQLNLTMPQIIFCFALQVGMLPLTGTTNTKHMQQDIICTEINLNESIVSLIESIAEI